MQGPPQHTTSKPGTACLSCRNRKLRCSREPEGCSNCAKGEIQCTYLQAEVGLKRKRGPYKKRKHDQAAPESHDNTIAGADYSLHDTSARNDFRSGSQVDDTHGASNSTISEHLVQDALVALAKPLSPVIGTNEPCSGGSVAPDRATIEDSRFSRLPENLQPSARQAIELWHLFTTRVAPLTRLIHCPSYLPKLLATLDGQTSTVEVILASSVIYSALSSCSAAEVQHTLHRRKDELLMEYGQFIEVAVAQQIDIPCLELLQALLLYMICKRRDENEAGHWMLFSSILRGAQAMALNVDPGPDHTPFEAELRRRAWWTLCGLEARRAEEGATKTNSLMTSHEVQLPANIDDRDLWPGAQESFESREGVTDMSFVLGRWKIQLMTHELWCLRRAARESLEAESEENIHIKQRSFFAQFEENLNQTLLQHCHTSRPWDRLILALSDVMIVSLPLEQTHVTELTRLADQGSPFYRLSMGWTCHSAEVTRAAARHASVLRPNHQIHAHVARPRLGSRLGVVLPRVSPMAFDRNCRRRACTQHRSAFFAERVVSA